MEQETQKMNKNAAAAKKIGRHAWKIIRWPLFVAIVCRQIIRTTHDFS
jgi:hypothetical protein